MESDDVGAVPPADFLARLDRVEHDDEVQQRLNREMEAFQRRLLQQSWDLQSTFSKPLNLEKHFVPPEPRQLSRSQTPPTSSVSGPGQAAFSDMRATEAALQQEQQELQQQLEEAARARHRGPATAAEEARPEATRAARLARAAMAPLGLAELPLRAMPTTAARAGSAAPREAPNAARPLSPRSFSYPRAPSVRSEHEAQREASCASRPLSPRVPRASPLRSREAAAHDRRGSPRRPASPLAGAAGDGGGGGGVGSAGNGDFLVEDAVRATSARRQKALPPRAGPSASPRHQKVQPRPTLVERGAAAAAGVAAVVRARSPRSGSPNPRSFSRRAEQERPKETEQTAAAAAAEVAAAEATAVALAEAKARVEAEASVRAAAEERAALAQARAEAAGADAAPAAVEAAARKAPAAGEAAATGLGGGTVPGSPLRRRRATPYPLPSHPAAAVGSDGAEADWAEAGPREARHPSYPRAPSVRSEHAG